MADTTWSAYGACETCGCVPGWPCHRGKRQLKNAHPGRPRTGQEPYMDSFAGVTAAEYRDHLAGREVADDARPPLAAEPRFSGCTCPEPMVCPECCHDLECPMAEDPRVWCDCRDDETCSGPCQQRAHDPRWPPPGAHQVTDPMAPWGWADIALRGRDPEDVIAGNEPRDAKLIDYLAAQAMPPAEAELDDTTTGGTAVAGASYTLENAERFPTNPTGKRRVDAEVPREIDRDQYDRPKLVRAELVNGAWQISPTGEVEGYTRASTLGNALESSEGLSIWRGGMIVYGMSRRKDLVLAAQAIPGTEDKKLHRRPLYAIADQAKEAAEASSAATVGTALHALTDQADRGNLTVDIGEYQPVLDIYLERMAGWKVVQSETFVVSDHFHAAGSFDRLITPLEPMALVDRETGEIITVIMPGDLIVVDLKTSTTADYFGAKFFAQLAVYVTGQGYDRDKESPTYGARTPLGQRTDFALILHIPQGGDADGEPVADWQWLDMRAGLALAQLACVVLETRKKRFTRTHMRPVLAEPAPDHLVVEGAGPGWIATTQPTALPARDPLGSQHLAVTAGFIAEAESFPDAEADRVDAELAQDGRMPEERRPSPAAVLGTNMGTDATPEDAEPYVESPPGDWITVHLAGRDPGDVIAANEPSDAELIDALEELYRRERAAEVGVTVHRSAEEAREHGDPQHWVDGGHVPGPDETAPLPDGWESRAEQDLAREITTEVPKALGRSLQDAAERHRVEGALIRKIGRASSVRGPDGLTDLYERASKAGYWTDRVKAAATARRLELTS
jgi:hypothetical protein